MWTVSALQARGCLIALLKGGIEGFLPSFVIDGPVDLGFPAPLQNRGPNSSVALVPCHVEAVHHSHSQSQVARSLHVHIVLGLFCNNRRVYCHSHGYRVRQGNAMFTSLF